MLKHTHTIFPERKNAHFQILMLTLQRGFSSLLTFLFQSLAHSNCKAERHSPIVNSCLSKGMYSSMTTHHFQLELQFQHSVLPWNCPTKLTTKMDWRFSNTHDVCGSDFLGLSSHNHAVDELDYYLMDSLPDDCLECMKLVEGKL